MAVTEFRAEIAEGTGFDQAITVSMIADDVNIALWGPVVLADASITDLPHAASTTTAGDRHVFGVCVALPANGVIVADSDFVQICIQGFCKVKVNDANVALGDPLETNSTVGEARIQPDPTVDVASSAALGADVVIVANNIRKCFAIALTTVTSGADSIVLCKVAINSARGNVT